MTVKHAAVVLCLATALAATAEEPTLELIMSDPDWIGHAPEAPYWGDDGQQVFYRQRRNGEDYSDLWAQPLSGEAARVDESAMPRDSGRHKVYSADRTHVAWLRDGDVLLKVLDSGEVTRLTATVSDESRLVFSPAGERLYFQREGQYFAYDLASRETTQVTDLREDRDPDQVDGFDTLRAHHARNYTTVVESRRRQMAKNQAGRVRDLRPDPIFLGDGYQVLERQLSPAGDVLALVVSDRSAEADRKGSMPNYVTADGYVATREVRTRVGRNTQADQQVLLVDLDSGHIREVDTGSLPGIKSDPLAGLRQSALEWHVERGANRADVAAALKAPERRVLTVNDIGSKPDGLKWSPDGSRLAIQFIAADFKDRWLVTVDPDDEDLGVVVQEHLQDPAWINWKYNTFGWLPDSQSLWYLSERSGYAHLYRKDLDARKPRALTSGSFVVREPAIGPRGEYAWVVSNRAHPGNYEIYRVPLSGGELEQVTDLDGVSSFTLSPDGRQLLVLRSWIDSHADLYLGNSDGSGDLRRLTNTVSRRYATIDWSIPEIVEVPSSHTDRPVYSKLYLPRDFDPSKRWPAVMFVHGAGYTQNAHMGWPYYFREFMFHTLLNNAGYVVLDMDYRGSEGYGRDWRTTIYRNMGHPELEDYLDGIEFLADNYGVARDRVGIYGGSYGGFMTFMALFRAPDAFAAGAALRPVADWMHYEYDYTRRILNTPLIDPEAYQRSSPINHAAGLKAPLLIASGMQDDNVFFQDSVLMVQRLLELKKPDFEIAIYPLDGHGFTNPESWLDEYRRIFRLMQDNLH